VRGGGEDAWLDHSHADGYMAAQYSLQEARGKSTHEEAYRAG
jgi:hypothetical protein